MHVVAHGNWKQTISQTTHIAKIKLFCNQLTVKAIVCKCMCVLLAFFNFCKWKKCGEWQVRACVARASSKKWNETMLAKVSCFSSFFLFTFLNLFQWNQIDHLVLCCFWQINFKLEEVSFCFVSEKKNTLELTSHRWTKVRNSKSFSNWGLWFQIDRRPFFLFIFR